jgi:hypothetical protein
MACNEFKMNKGCALEEQTTWRVRCAGYILGAIMNYSIHLLLYAHIQFIVCFILMQNQNWVSYYKCSDVGYVLESGLLSCCKQLYALSHFIDIT